MKDLKRFICVFSFTMSKRVVQNCLRVCNFLGITSLKMNTNKQFEFSKSAALLNIIKTPFVIVTSLSLSFYLPLRDIAFNTELSELDRYSNFSILIMMVFVYLEQVTSLTLSYLNLYKRKNFVELTNRLIILSVNEKCQQKFLNIVTRQIRFIVVLITLIMISQFTACMNMSCASFCFFCILNYSYLVNVGSMTLIKVFGTFLIVLLKDLKAELKAELTKQELSFENASNMLKTYQNIYELNEEFHKTFGMQMTVLACSITTISTLQVNFKFFIQKLNLKFLFPFLSFTTSFKEF